MSVSVYVPTPFRQLTGGQPKVKAQGADILALVEDLETNYPGLKRHICDENGQVKHFINIYVNGTEIRSLQGVQTPLKDGDEVAFIPAMAGGEIRITEENMVTVKVDQELDLRGEVCPYTFVKSKLALEMMETGQVLRVIVDHLPATNNVPRSMSNEGHQVLNVAPLNATDWGIVVRKC